jgi:hypothetical protein
MCMLTWKSVSDSSEKPLTQLERYPDLSVFMLMMCEIGGVMVAGGREGLVGVGGLLTGGGKTYYTCRVGFACGRWSAV